VITVAISRAKLQSNRHQKQTNTQLLTGRMPFLSPNQQCQSTEVNQFHLSQNIRHNKTLVSETSLFFINADDQNWIKFTKNKCKHGLPAICNVNITCLIHPIYTENIQRIIGDSNTELYMLNAFARFCNNFPSDTTTALLSVSTLLGGPSKVKPTYIFVCKIWITFEWIDKIQWFLVNAITVHSHTLGIIKI